MTGKLRIAFSLLAAAVIAGACSSSSSTAAPSGSSLKIGVVTDVGSVDDQNFNQYSYEGAKAAAAALGATVNYAVPADASDYTTDIQDVRRAELQHHRDGRLQPGQRHHHGRQGQPEHLVHRRRRGPVRRPDRRPRRTFACKGDAATLLPKLIGIQFEEDQAGYLAGIVAAAVSKTGVIGQIGGINNNPAVVRYMQGYQLGAASYNPNIKVETGWFSTGDLTKAYGDPVWGKTFSTQFIAQQGVDVIFQVAGSTGNGALDAACAAGIYGIGVDVDEYLTYPSADKCLVTSAEKNVSAAVNQTVTAIANGTITSGSLVKGGIAKFNAANNGVGYAPLSENTLVTYPSDLQGKLDAALAAMKAGTLTTCPANCGTWSGS